MVSPFAPQTMPTTVRTTPVWYSGTGRGEQTWSYIFRPDAGEPLRLTVRLVPDTKREAARRPVHIAVFWRPGPPEGGSRLAGAARRMRSAEQADDLALVQGIFYAATGVWPLVSMRSFEAVTGPKLERWLVKTVGVLVTVIGAVLTLAGVRRRTTSEVALLAAGSAAGLAAVDVVYVAKRRISPVYLLDAVAELGLVLAWIRAHRAGPLTRG